MRNILKNTQEVCHYWSNQVQPSGKAGNVSFDGARLYSYRACIGRILDNGTIALSNQGYSVTTSKHQSDASGAARGRKLVHVAYPDSLSDSKLAAVNAVERLLRQASTAKARKGSYLTEALGYITSFNAFAEALGFQSERLAIPAMNDATLALIAVSVKADNKARNDQIKERAIQAALSLADVLAIWRAGGTQHYRLRQLPCALRVNGDAVQTSQGAEIPLSDALTLWPLVRRAMLHHTAYDIPQAMGHYRLTQIRADGSIVVGCHDIAYAEVAGVAALLGLPV